MLKTTLKKYEDHFYFIFRVLVGLLFFQHGAQKLFGWFGGQSVNLASMMGLAGIIEVTAGILIAVGLFSRIIALIAGAEMLVAYFMAHYPRNPIPILGGGELPLLYFAAFLVIMTRGSRKFALDNLFN